MQEVNKTTIRDLLMNMPADELDALFQAELGKDEPDPAMIRLFMEIFRKREPISQEMITPGIERAWEQYCERSSSICTEEKKNSPVPKWLVRIGATAAVLFLMISVVPSQASADGIWGKFSRWSSEFLEFFSRTDNEGRMEEYKFVSDNAELLDVYQTVTEQGISIPVVPMWIPEGYALSECKVITLPAKTSVIAAFVDGENTITMNFAVCHQEVAKKYQKDETDIQHYEVHNTDHVIMRNNDMWSVLWNQKNIEASIFINCQEETLYKIIESIYVMEGK